jgi:hypothetical protein
MAGTRSPGYNSSPGRLSYNVEPMERLDQGHVHPNLEVPGVRTDMSRPGIEPGPPAWEEKSHQDSLLMAIRTSTY